MCIANTNQFVSCLQNCASKGGFYGAGHCYHFYLAS